MRVSVIIPSRNRFSQLLECVESVKAQTYKDIEIVVVDDFSVQSEYTQFDWERIGVKMCRLSKSTESLLGYTSVGFAYNIGVYHSSGELIAFCDDRDIWYPEKLESQISAMERSGCGMSCTEAHAGHGRTLDKKILYHGEHYRKDLETIFKSSDQSWGGKIPELITLSLMNVHNLIIGGTVLMKKSLFNQIGGMTVLTMGREGYDCWKRCLEYTNCVHVEKPGIYYDLTRGSY